MGAADTTVSALGVRGRGKQGPRSGVALMVPDARLIVAVVALCCQAEEPTLQQGVKLTADGKTIDIEIGHLVPCVSDWNCDGKKDLIVGQFAEGKIRLYLNQGTDASPVFNDFSYLCAGGKPIRLDAG